jgi:uncharacterized protein YdeI (YjbR/CyaY-like superfamily)
MTRNVETYFLEGCGRCPLGGTPECKVHRWHHELLALRRLVLECGLVEACKWGVPCYTYQGKNIVMVATFKDNCFISFFKGALLHDEHNILIFPGPNAQMDKVIRFTRLEDILKIDDWIKTYIFEAIEVEKAGLKVPKSKMPELPEELLRKFEEVPAFKTAFEALTPGRKKGWILYFSAPKQTQTKVSRIVHSIPKILNGEGLHDEYKNRISME